MAQRRRSAVWAWAWVVAVVGGVAVGGWYAAKSGLTGEPAARAAGGDSVSQGQPQAGAAVHVDTVRPRAGDMDRTTEQPGTVQSYEAAHLYAGVSGYLKTQAVDIGDRVKPGQVLATVDVPELDQQVHRCTAALEQARARVTQMKARVTSAKADRDVAAAAVVYAQANAKSKAAELRFRQRQLERMRELFNLKSVDERLVDEKTEQRDAAQRRSRRPKRPS